jgi:hypothetical protein
MRWFLSRAVPEPTRVLVVESGPRAVAERLIPRLREVFGRDTTIDLLTCLPADPVSLRADSAAGSPQPGGGPQVWRVTDCADQRSRWRLLREIRSRRHPIAAVLCADSALMASWRLAALFLLPSKFLIVNENADFFWLDRGHWRNLLQLWMHRSGVFEESAVRAAARLAAFPFTLAFLLAYAGYVHLVRRVRLTAWRISRKPAATKTP